MRSLKQVTLEFDDGEIHVLKGAKAEAWRHEVDRALTLAALSDMEPGPDGRGAEGGPLLFDLLEDMGERGVAVLLHLHRNGGFRALTPEDIAEELWLPVEEVEGILEKLRGWGLAEQVGARGVVDP